MEGMERGRISIIVTSPTAEMNMAVSTLSIDDDSIVSVTADGIVTWRDLLYSLYNLRSTHGFQDFNTMGVILPSGVKYQFNVVQVQTEGGGHLLATRITFGTAAERPISIFEIHMHSSKSNIFYESYEIGTATQTDLSTNIPDSGTIIYMAK